MGHYYSEKHVDTPQERWAKALEQSLRDMGYRKIELDFKTFYICDSCGCLIAILGQHLWKCPAGDKSSEIDRMVDRAKDLILEQPGSIEQMKLVQLASQNRISVYALNCAIEALVVRQKVVRQHSFTKQYQDTMIVPKEEPECQPES